MLLRSVKDFEALTGPDALRPVERDLIEACRNGRPLILGDLPPEGDPDPKRHIRADLIRLLAVGGTEACRLHPVGIWLVGARITGVLDLSFMKTRGRVVLHTCRFEEEPHLTQAESCQISFDGSVLPGLFAQGIKVEDGLYLRKIISNGAINLSGAKIGGQLSCAGATLNHSDNLSLNAQGADCKQDLFLSNLTANGTVELNGAKIGGLLNFEGAALDSAGTAALNAQQLHVAEGFLFRHLKFIRGRIYLDGAHVGNLVDDAASWPKGNGEIYLNGFSFDRVSGSSPLTFEDRKDWLARGSRFKDRFYPQPYNQFAKVLREMGHASEARKVVRERDRLLFVETHKANKTAVTEAWGKNRGDVGKVWLRWRLTQVWDWFTRVFSGYGHAPQFALFWSVGIVLFGWVWLAIAWQAGVMVPNSAVIMTSADWLCAVANHPDQSWLASPAHAWANTDAATHYETFYSLPFALDAYAPLVSLGQEETWAATTTTNFGKITRWFIFGFKITGWAITALGLAAITGFIQKNQPD